MKWMIAIALFAVAILIATGSAAAETPQQAYYQTILYSVPPVPVMEMCFVNGVNYPVGYSYRIWAAYGYGGWVVIGKMNEKHWSAVITRRSDNVRIISVRRSRDEEIEIHESQDI